ncbi:hypothetical protein HYV88_04865 [Candidatus Woesearchaeota archaeon]|nr:hypothetical protein [Candidatus Woesearchaeota archaeon]
MSLGKKALVVEDNPFWAERFKELEERFDCPILTILKNPRRDSLDERFLQSIEKCLRDIKYEVILMDGHLDLKLGGEGIYAECDGTIIIRNLREAHYGELNLNTPIYSISSGGRIEGSIGSLGKSNSTIRKTVDFIIQKYLT